MAEPERRALLSTFDGDGLSSRPWAPAGIWQLGAWSDASRRAMTAAVLSLLGATAVEAGRALLGGGWRLFPVAPRRWLLVGDRPDPAPPAASDFAMAGVTGAFAGLSLDGARSRDLLAKLIALDLHPSVFPDHAFATTRLEGAAIHLHRAGADRFDLLLPASFAEHALAAIADAALEFGAAIPPDLLHRPTRRLPPEAAGFG